MNEINYLGEINEPRELCLDLDEFEDIYFVYGGYKIKLNKSKILMFLELFRE